MTAMINWEKVSDNFFTVYSEATDLNHLEHELTEAIVSMIELNLFKKDFVEFYSEATNGSFFINELDESKERINDSVTVHFCALKIWEDYEDSNEFDLDMKTTLYRSIENLTQRSVKIPFRIILRDELGDEEEI